MNKHSQGSHDSSFAEAEYFILCFFERVKNANPISCSFRTINIERSNSFGIISGIVRCMYGHCVSVCMHLMYGQTDEGGYKELAVFHELVLIS